VVIPRRRQEFPGAALISKHKTVLNASSVVYCEKIKIEKLRTDKACAMLFYAELDWLCLLVFGARNTYSTSWIPETFEDLRLALE